MAASSSILDDFSLPEASSDALQAVLQHFGLRIGRIRDLLLEIDSLPLDIPNLAAVGFTDLASIQVTFLDLESQTKFTCSLTPGEVLLQHLRYLPIMQCNCTQLASGPCGKQAMGVLATDKFMIGKSVEYCCK